MVDFGKSDKMIKTSRKMVVIFCSLFMERNITTKHIVSI